MFNPEHAAFDYGMNFFHSELRVAFNNFEMRIGMLFGEESFQKLALWLIERGFATVKYWFHCALNTQLNIEKVFDYSVVLHSAWRVNGTPLKTHSAPCVTWHN